MAGNSTFTIWNRMGGTLKSASYYTSLYEFGNTRFRGTDSGTGNALAIGTKHMHSGKWYFEFLVDGSPAGGWPAVGIMAATDVGTGQKQGNPQMESIFSWVFATSGNLKAFGGTTNASYGTSFSDGDIYNLAVDIDAGKAWWGKNNTYFNSGNPATGTNAGQTFTAGTDMAVCMTGYVGAAKLIINSGQDSNFSGQKSTGTNSAADSNGYGDFYYAPPSGFLSLNSANLPTSTDIDPTQTDDDIPTKQFGAETFTGNGGTQTIQLGDGFQPDLVITKNTGSTNSWIVLDSSRGYNKTLKLEEPDAEGTNSFVGYGIESDFFASTGIKANDGGSPGFNNSTANYIVYGWRANGGTTSTNTSGTITTTVQANTAAGFSILTYTGTGTNATLGHGLSQAPDTVWIKNRDQGDSWFVYMNVPGLGNNKFVSLDAHVGSSFSGTSYFQATSPSSTVITIGTDHKLNASTEKYVAYCWHNVEGYSKFGQFTGNGNEDGPYVYTGFRPRFLMYISLRFSGSPHWEIIDAARSIDNPMRQVLQADANSAQFSTADRHIDFMGSGFKVRASDAYDVNSSSGMAYWCWGDVPYKFGNAF